MTGAGSGSTASITRNFKSSKKSAGLSVHPRATIRWATTITFPRFRSGCANTCASADSGLSSSAYLRCPSACSYSAYYSTLPYRQASARLVMHLESKPLSGAYDRGKTGPSLYFPSNIFFTRGRIPSCIQALQAGDRGAPRP